MSLTHDDAENLARNYTAAWYTGEAEAVAAFFASDGGIVSNGGHRYRVSPAAPFQIIPGIRTRTLGLA